VLLHVLVKLLFRSVTSLRVMLTMNMECNVPGSLDWILIIETHCFDFSITIQQPMLQAGMTFSHFPSPSYYSNEINIKVLYPSAK